MNGPQSPPEKPRHVRGFSFLARLRATPLDAWLLGGLLGAIYVGLILALRWQAPYTDEVIHFSQVWLLAQGQWRVLADLTTIPGYHLVLAQVLGAFGHVNLQDARLLNAGLGLLAIAGFHALRTRLWPGTQSLASAQLIMLPILLPLFFLVYTDALALALLLWAAWACVAARHWLASVLLCALVATRQNAVVWSGLLALLALPESNLRQALAQWRTQLALVGPYLLPVAAFVAFWAWNGSISLSHDQSALHPDLSLHAGNCWMALVGLAILMPVQVFQGLVDAWRRFGRRPWFLPSFLLLAGAFWFSFRADNPYNSVLPGLYLHNRLPLLIEQEPWLRAGAGLLASISAWALAMTCLHPRRAAWLFPFAVLFLAASWLVELRYVMVPLVLWLAMREQRRPAIEWGTLLYWLALSGWLMDGILARRLFL